MTHLATAQAAAGGEAALAAFSAQLERLLAKTLVVPDEHGLDPRWARAQTELRAYTLRPAKRVRPMLLVTGWALAGGDLSRGVPEGVEAFAVALELLHTFMLIHDDVADRAATRRGGASLHTMLGAGKAGEDLAVVLGDHVYARALEVMLGSGLPGAPAATRYMLGVCRHTAVGQYLDLDLSRAPLSEVTLFATLKVATLKTARYGFVAPLVLGAMLGGADEALLEVLERVGRQMGLAFQLRDDVIGLFGDDRVAGKDGGGDFHEGKRTFPLIAGWTRADASGRQALEALWALPEAERAEAGQLARARAELERWGGGRPPSASSSA
jgi:geranylgeranyl diphosphate synthase type I